MPKIIYLVIFFRCVKVKEIIWCQITAVRWVNDETTLSVDRSKNIMCLSMCESSHGYEEWFGSLSFFRVVPDTFGSQMVTTHLEFTVLRCYKATVIRRSVMPKQHLNICLYLFSKKNYVGFGFEYLYSWMLFFFWFMQLHHLCRTLHSYSLRLSVGEIMRDPTQRNIFTANWWFNNL